MADILIRNNTLLDLLLIYRKEHVSIRQLLLQRLQDWRKAKKVEQWSQNSGCSRANLSF